MASATGLSACIYLPEEGIWNGVSGVEDGITKKPITADSKFHAGSIGKMVTAILILKLIERNQFTLETKIDRWFPGALHAGTISIDHLLNHTSGLPGAIASDVPSSALMSEKINAALKQELLFQPGTGFSYSNIGYMALGLVLENEYGLPLHQVIENEFIRALNLQNTRAITFQNKDDILINSTHNGNPGKNSIDYSSVGGAGIIATTPCDLVRFLNALLAREIVNSTTLNNLGKIMYPMTADGGLRCGVFPPQQSTTLGTWRCPVFPEGRGTTKSDQ